MARQARGDGEPALHRRPDATGTRLKFLRNVCFKTSKSASAVQPRQLPEIDHGRRVGEGAGSPST
jgi:hypothetical protein